MCINLSNIDWQAVSALAAVFTAFFNIVVIVTIIIGYRSLKENILSRDASLLTWAIQCMTEIKEDLDVIRKARPYGKLSDITLKSFKTPWNQEEEKAAHHVSVILQRLSYLANSGLISKIHLKKMWGPTFVEAWDLLEVWVKHMRFRNDEPIELCDGAFSRNDFERFASECNRD